MGLFSIRRLVVEFPKAALAITMLASALAAQPANTILLERWDGIGGSSVTDLTTNANYPDNPTSRAYPTNFEIPLNVADGYGTRARGYVTPPTTGNYTFWIAADDNAELWLGTSSDPSTARIIASAPTWTGSREWTKFSQQQSAVIALTAGTSYYIETRHKEGSGGDNLAVGWQGPGITGETERPIPGTRLSPFVLTSPAAKTMLVERWDGITGGNIASLTSSANYPNNPTSRYYATLYELPSNVAESYGTRTRGYITPPTTGSYTFWISSDDNSELWLGTSSDPATISRIAFVNTFTLSREWTKLAEQQSAPVTLTAGVSYYIETRQKENTGFDNLAVGWQGPGITGEAERPIPGNRLSPFIYTAPTIATQPASQTVNAGQTATFSVVPAGTAPFTYQWRRNGTNISGATSAGYTTAATVTADNGALFSVMVTNAVGSAISANATLTVKVGPSITTPPANQAVVVGQTATFCVVASGTAPFSYQWRRNGTNITGATSACYTTPATVAADNGAVYSVVVTNLVSSVTSQNATLAVNVPATITTQPVSQSVNDGQAVAFSVTATGTAPLAYQWLRNGTALSGATTAAYSLASVSPSANNSVFRCVVSNIYGVDTSLAATLTVVLLPPTLTQQPATTSTYPGQTAIFQVAASGSLPFTFQWFKNGAAISGATQASYSTSPVTFADDSTSFTCSVGNAAGQVTSNAALLRIVPKPAIPTSELISVSGRISDGAGNPLGAVTPATIDLLVRLYPVRTGGTPVLTESFLAINRQAITVQGGFFVARLGEGVADRNALEVLATQPNLFAEFQANSGTGPEILTPRIPVTSPAYSGAPLFTSGAGVPAAPAKVGTLYQNTSNTSLWVRTPDSWVRIGN